MALSLLEAREVAKSDYQKLRHQELGLLAGWRRFYMVFGRDGQQFMDCLEQPQNAYIPGILTDSEVFLNLHFKHQGTVHNPDTDEAPGKLFHQLANGFTPPDEFEKLVEGGRKVEVINGERLIRSFTSIDATPGGTRAVAILAKAHEFVAPEKEKGKERDRIINKFWDGVKAAYAHDIKDGDPDGDGLLESIPQRPDILLHHTERDSGYAYNLEDGTTPEPPYTYLKPNAISFSARQKLAWMAGIMGEPDLQKDALESSEHIRNKMRELFWMPSGYASPLLYGYNKKQARIFTDEAMDLLYYGVLHPQNDQDKIEQLVQRFKRLDIWTPWGPRSRSSESSQFYINGSRSYWNGNIWFMRIGKIARALENSGYVSEARQLDSIIPKVIEKFGGCLELFPLDEQGNPTDYAEIDEVGRIIGVACMPQLFGAGSVFERTAHLEPIHFPPVYQPRAA